VNLAAQITAYLHPPFVVCDAALATALAMAGQQRLTAAMGITAAEYSIANCLYSLASGAQGITTETELPLIEGPEWGRLASFYEEHGLEPLSYDELVATQAAEKLGAAWRLLQRVPAVGNCLRTLVKTIQVLRSPDPEIDVSYSHPAVPFSVFVSVGDDNSLVAALRVAESLLHEAMHLKLTLLEAETALLHAGCQGLYYSPWRDENRPARGVLHGLFVFAAVREFYAALTYFTELHQEEVEFIEDRLATITDEFAVLQHFPEAADLTASGHRLATAILAPAAAVSTR
jgi:HEXXH motif-containing protein